MFQSELIAVITVCERFQDFIAENVNVVDIVISCRRFQILNDDLYYDLLRKFREAGKDRDDRIRQFYELMVKIIPLTSLSAFKWIISDAGYHDLSKAITLQVNGVIRDGPAKKALPYSETVNTYFASLKRCADSQCFQDGTIFRLKSIISSLTKKIEQSLENPGRFQLLVDERVMAYFLLAQQYSDMESRLSVLRSMRRSMPFEHVDISLFETIYNSYMVVIWAIKDDMNKAERYELKARSVNWLFLPGIASLVLRFCVQYKNNIAYLRRQNDHDLQHATTDFEEIFQMFEFVENGTDVYRAIAMLELVHTLLGIDWNLEVRPNNEVKQCNIEKASVVLSSFSEPVQPRRKMLYYLCRARLLECKDPMKAESFAAKALAETAEGTYYDLETQNIQNYINHLKVQRSLNEPNL